MSMHDIVVEQVVDGRRYQLTRYTVAEWYALAAAGCPLPTNIVDEFKRVWIEVRR